MGGIRKNEIIEDYGFIEIFQKIMYRQYKKFIIDSVWFYRILDIHSNAYNLMKDEKISIKEYFEIVGKITEKFQTIAYQKEKKGIFGMNREVEGMRKFIQDRKNEEL